MYKVHIKFYDDYNSVVVKNYLFVAADGIKNTVEQLEAYYGVNNIEKVTIEPFSPDNMLIFEEDEKELFNIVSNTLSKKVVW